MPLTELLRPDLLLITSALIETESGQVAEVHSLVGHAVVQTAAIVDHGAELLLVALSEWNDISDHQQNVLVEGDFCTALTQLPEFLKILDMQLHHLVLHLPLLVDRPTLADDLAHLR